MFFSPIQSKLIKTMRISCFIFWQQPHSNHERSNRIYYLPFQILILLLHRMPGDHLSTGAPPAPLCCVAHKLFIPGQIREETVQMNFQSWVREMREHAQSVFSNFTAKRGSQSFYKVANPRFSTKFPQIHPLFVIYLFLMIMLEYNIEPSMTFLYSIFLIIAF